MAEVRITDETLIGVSAAQVWAAIKDPATHAHWHPFVTAISGEHRLDATRSCSVVVGKKTGQTKERCIEDEQERRLSWAIEEDSTGFSRMVSDWRAGFDSPSPRRSNPRHRGKRLRTEERIHSPDEPARQAQVPPGSTGNPRRAQTGGRERRPESFNVSLGRRA